MNSQDIESMSETELREALLESKSTSEKLYVHHEAVWQTLRNNETEMTQIGHTLNDLAARIQVGDRTKREIRLSLALSHIVAASGIHAAMEILISGLEKEMNIVREDFADEKAGSNFERTDNAINAAREVLNSLEHRSEVGDKAHEASLEEARNRRY